MIINDGIRQQDLALTTIKDKATVARSLAQLEEEQLVTRISDTVDRRQKLIHLTEKGRCLWQCVEANLGTLMPEITMNIEPEKLATCLEVLASIYSSLNKPVLTSVTNSHE